MKITIGTEGKKLDKPLEDVKVPIEIFIGLLQCMGYNMDEIKQYIYIEAL